MKTVEELDSGDGADGDAPRKTSAAGAAPEARPAAVNTPPDLVLGEATQVMADIMLGNLPNQKAPTSTPPQQTAKRLAN